MANIQRCLLRVNLRTQKINQEEISVDDIQLFLGGRVLGDMLLYKELAAGIDPLSPENKLIFSTGPLTGTSAPGTPRYIVHTKSPLTGLYLNGLAGGYFGPELRRTGYDVLIIEEKSDVPIYLVILDGKVEFREAGSIWGMNTRDVQSFIKDELNDSRVRIACIGPAGENLVLFAAIVSERRGISRGGAGAVMGSKNLKAIAVRGTKDVPIADSNAFRTAIEHTLEDINSNYERSKLYPLYGSMAAMPTLHEYGMTPWRNWQEASVPGGESIFPQNWRDKYVKKDVRCAPPCNLKCSKLSLATEGEHIGVLSEGIEYETEYALGACCDIKDQSAIIEADALCDDYGLDTISMGVSIAFAMECYEKGIITKKDTGSQEIKFGKADLLSKLIRDTAYRRGFGEILSQGTKRMAVRFGQGSDAFAMHAKGMELGGYDPRGAKSVALVYACGPRGGCHKAGGSGNGQTLKEIATGNARFSVEGKATLTKTTRENRVLADSAILCIFPQMVMKDETIAELLNAATGLSWSISDLHSICERGSNIERAFNVREGLTRHLDTLPPRLLNESVKSGPNQGHIVELDKLLDDFYDICGWDIKTGIPTPSKLSELGLHNISQDMASYLQTTNE
jgi:aldehyde:ferredoxin oxidoreductase